MSNALPAYMRRLEYDRPLPINPGERICIKDKQVLVHQICSELLCETVGVVEVDYKLEIAPTAPSDDSECKLEWYSGPLEPPANYPWQ